MSSEEIIESRVSRMFFGGFSSAVGLVATHPLDVVKISIQAEPWKIKEVMRYYYHYNLRIYKGIGGSVARALVICNIRFELYEEAKRRNLLNTTLRKFIGSGLSGGLGAFCITPMSKVHIRTQCDNVLPLKERRYYRNLYDGLRRIYLAEGFKGLYAGAIVSTLRGTMSAFGQLAIYDETKSYLERKYPMYFGENYFTYLVSSIFAGFITTLLQQPFEVLQTRVMIAPPGMFKNARAVTRFIIHRFGMFGFYKGLTPGFIRIVPQTVITYTIFEHLRENYGRRAIRRRTGKEQLEEIIVVEEEKEEVDEEGEVNEDEEEDEEKQEQNEEETEEKEVQKENLKVEVK